MPALCLQKLCSHSVPQLLNGNMPEMLPKSVEEPLASARCGNDLRRWPQSSLQAKEDGGSEGPGELLVEKQWAEHLQKSYRETTEHPLHWRWLSGSSLTASGSTSIFWLPVSSNRPSQCHYFFNSDRDNTIDWAFLLACGDQAIFASDYKSFNRSQYLFLKKTKNKYMWQFADSQTTKM